MHSLLEQVFAKGGPTGGVGDDDTIRRSAFAFGNPGHHEGEHVGHQRFRSVRGTADDQWHRVTKSPLELPGSAPRLAQ